MRINSLLPCTLASLLLVVCAGVTYSKDLAVTTSPAASPEPHPASGSHIQDTPMILIPAGEFAMGDDRGQDDEQPVHRVTVNAFYMDPYEVTVTRYAEFLHAQKPDAPFKWQEANFTIHARKPVIGVNWFDARDYCRWVGKRLPTEAEWELAARGTEGRIYPWGNAHPTKGHTNAGQIKWRGYDTLSDVGKLELGKTPNGVYDLAGNLWEWVADWYDSTYYQFSPRDNPIGPRAGPLRSLRGGAWNNDSKTIRSANRAGYAPDARRNDVGFRCARNAQPPSPR